MPGGGGLLQLVAQGKQDVFLTGNPQMTWFKMVYRRYTNFAIESQAIYFDGDPDFGKRVTALIPRRGDMLGPMLLEVVLPYVYYTDGTAATYVNSTGYALIEEISLEIGEQEIDKQTGESMEIWSTLNTPVGLVDALNNMVGRVDGFNTPYVTPTQSATTCTVGNYQKGAVKLYIPLQFWFTKTPGLYLPLLALQYHPVRINLKLRSLSDMLTNSNTSLTCSTLPQPQPTKIIDLRLWGDYVYLDVEERRRFVANTHEYLIEQVQYTPAISIPKEVNIHTVRLEFNHPLRELVWVLQRDIMLTTHEWFNYSSRSRYESGLQQDILQSAILQLDGYDRFDERDAGYFRLVQPYQYHTNVDVKNFIYMYSFALRPEEMQPSGSLNASRIDNMNLQISLNPDTNLPTDSAQYVPPRGPSHITVYAKNHNILRVVNGFAGLLFKI